MFSVFYVSPIMARIWYLLVCPFPPDHGLMRTQTMNHSGISRASCRCYVFNQHLLNEGISRVTPVSPPTSETPFCSYTSQPGSLPGSSAFSSLHLSPVPFPYLPGRSQKGQETLELQTHRLPAQASSSCVAYRKFTLPLWVSVLFHL